MFNRKFRIGSSNRRYRKSTHYNRISARLSLAGLSSGAKLLFRGLSKLNWINLLKGMKLITEIAKEIRSLISCQQPRLLLERRVQDKVSIS